MSMKQTTMQGSRTCGHARLKSYFAAKWNCSLVLSINFKAKQAMLADIHSVHDPQL